ncbi:MAG: sigma-70 family RNA polymerase sigma factor [Ruminococcaceae bacterium]|nr:sigma-70 family RNA polymerase sigma factor [Oscillospiraceae bacterium]
MEDNRIIELYISRDERAIGQTAAKYGTRLKHIAVDITQDSRTAEECENDTYMQAWNTIPPHNPVDYLFAYLARIIRHIAIDACRTQGRLKRSAVITELTAEMEECIPAPDDVASQVEYRELGEAISRYLRTLSEEKQIIFVRRYWYLDSVAAISVRLGISQSKVKMILLRCRNGLREYLKEEGYDL